MAVEGTNANFMVGLTPGSGEAAEDGGAESWLVALAKGLGEGLGKQAARMVGLANSMSAAAGDTSAEGAQRFSALSSQFQATSQLFSINSNAISTSLKAIGEGSTTLARGSK